MSPERRAAGAPCGPPITCGERAARRGRGAVRVEGCATNLSRSDLVDRPRCARRREPHAQRSPIRLLRPRQALLAVVALVLPAVFQLVEGGGLPSPTEESKQFLERSRDACRSPSRSCSCSRTLIGLLFSLRTHALPLQPARRGGRGGRPSPGSVRRAVIYAHDRRIAVRVMSEILVGSISEASEDYRPVAVLRRRDRRCDHRQRGRALGRDLLRQSHYKMHLSVNISIGSSAQIALFVGAGAGNARGARRAARAHGEKRLTSRSRRPRSPVAPPLVGPQPNRSGPARYRPVEREEARSVGDIDVDSAGGERPTASGLTRWVPRARRPPRGGRPARGPAGCRARGRGGAAR